MRNYHVRFVHKISPRDTDVSEVSLPDTAFADRRTLARHLRKAGTMIHGSRIVEMRVEGDKVVVFPMVPGHTTYWHSIILTAE